MTFRIETVTATRTHSIRPSVHDHRLFIVWSSFHQLRGPWNWSTIRTTPCELSLHNAAWHSKKMCGFSYAQAVKAPQFFQDSACSDDSLLFSRRMALRPK